MNTEKGTEWNGLMQGCLWKDCPQSCCNPKKVVFVDGVTPLSIDRTKSSIIDSIEVPYTVHGPLHEYTVALDEREASFIATHYDNVKVEEVTIIRAVHKTQNSAIVDTITTLTKCLGDMGCLLGSDRPALCKLFPFWINTDNPFEFIRCPAALEIVMNSDNVKNALHLRKKLDCTDNRAYLDALIAWIRERGREPQREFLEDDIFIKNL